LHENYDVAIESCTKYITLETIFPSSPHLIGSVLKLNQNLT